jgi:hypothetical protein
MATTESYYQDPAQMRTGLGDKLPVISQGLDSIRAYQFEIHFEFPSDLTEPNQDKLTLAAKQVQPVGFATEAIEVNRVNDKVFYPGKATPESLSVTFDNLYQPDVSNMLWRWFASIYNPTTGQFNGNGGPIKANMATITQLDAQGQPLNDTRLFGVYPESWKTAEFNYSTNEFHTIEVIFKYDFMEQDAATTKVPSTTNI